MTNYCSYQDCQNIQRSFASITFFNLPTDDRREIWIKNSGNERLKNLDASLRRVFCEYHFDPKYLRRQFNRTILRRDAIPYPYTESPASQEIEYIEMAESEEEPEQCQSEPIESSNEQNEVVIVLKKSPNIQMLQRKSSNVSQIKPNLDKRIMNLKKELERKPAKEEKDEEIDFIVLEEISQEATENTEEPVENEEVEPNASKKMRLEMEQTAHGPNESSQPEKVEEIAIQKPAVQKITNVQLPVARKSTDGIVSSSETVDANNEETYFALSLVGILKRLPPHKRAIAKCHILSYLTELEYGSSSLS
ncbi:uncharacterized protein LOC129569612 [Sitodiplosis mosellana]|uniref:uncharacterized protein LOC129569612 n=1 Tax=Sitodiplosis mosellana TaxID=263140 RepID=UPI0024442FE7|nr:uncharacterized protein LOC129569612 [Sitodiplosis mosellana]